jgi:copper chaperone CopZ
MLNSSKAKLKWLYLQDSMKTMASKLFLILLFSFLFHFTGAAQYKSAVIGVDGLTCSACSFATQQSLLELKAVDSVHMQLEQNTATVFFKEGQKVSIKDLAKKVVDAGFSVRSITATIHVKEVDAIPDGCWGYENDTYHFIKLDAPKKINGEVQLTFIGEKFMQPKEFKKWKMYSKNTCNSNGAPNPYSQDYYVTIQ